MLNVKRAGAVMALSAAVGLLLTSQPSLDDRLESMEPFLDQQLAERKVHIDPGELLDLIYNLNMRLMILDVRVENEFNLFHIIDAQRVTMLQVRDPGWVKKLPAETIFVVVSNGESRAALAWKLLRVKRISNLYLLAGGINYWIEVYGPKNRMDARSKCAENDDCRQYTFEAALGSKHPESDPDPKKAPQRKYEKKVKNIGRKAPKKGACG